MRPYEIVILDENMSPDLAKRLCNRYNVMIPRRGMTDIEILELAVMLDGFILTRDKGFPDYSKLIYCRRTSIGYIEQKLRECEKYGY